MLYMYIDAIAWYNKYIGGEAMARPKTKTTAQIKNDYAKKAYDDVRLQVKKGKKEVIKAHAEARGESVNGFINRAIDNQISQDRRKGPSEAVQGPSEGLAVSLPSEAYKCAVDASEAAGEGLPDFVARAVTIQAQRDEIGRKMEGGEANE